MTWLPMWLLYRLSDITAPVLYHLVRYRRDIVRRNLAGTFPDLSPKELRRLERQFYRDFTDNFFEAVKLLSISDREMRRRVIFENIELVDRYFDRGRSIVAYFAHTANWEWATSITLWTRHKANRDVTFAQVYRPLRNPRFDRLFLKLRSRFGSLSFKKATVLRDLVRLRRDGNLSITGFMSDQKPSHGDPGHLTRFLNRPTAMISGTEHLARKLGCAVVYMDMWRERRGRYRVRIVDMASDASATAPGELTERYRTLLESTIRRHPSGWLWSHNRWKNPVTLHTSSPEPALSSDK